MQALKSLGDGRSQLVRVYYEQRDGKPAGTEASRDLQTPRLRERVEALRDEHECIGGQSQVADSSSDEM